MNIDLCCSFLNSNNTLHDEVDLRREKEAREKETKKLQAKKGKMKVDGSAKKKKGSSGFQVGKKKVETKMTALNKAKAMNLDK
ncbi:hypothetical protein MKW98_028026 [Papaver atlanticum]|uniref:Uncharacterized protein n=1 Tax=Papaver atlanticum TaxID=357466 RepID=A0AAD4XRF3_9MAGN|nr:hypothetical protein MKW98_028026 [Papaver atlanticum]